MVPRPSHPRRTLLIEVGLTGLLTDSPRIDPDLVSGETRIVQAPAVVLPASGSNLNMATVAVVVPRALVVFRAAAFRVYGTRVRLTGCERRSDIVELGAAPTTNSQLHRELLAQRVDGVEECGFVSKRFEPESVVVCAGFGEEVTGRSESGDDAFVADISSHNCLTLSSTIRPPGRRRTPHQRWRTRSPGPGSDGSRNSTGVMLHDARVTAVEQIELATPTDLAAGLRLLGIGWNVRPADTASRTGDLYTWVYGQPNRVAPTDAMQRGVLYVGVDQGVKGRTAREESWRGGWHGHGLAIERAHATVVTGAVEDLGSGAAEHQLGKGAQPAYANEVAVGLARLERDRNSGQLVAAAERIAVRFCMHLGVIGAAVNAQYASAWRVQPSLQPYDDLAFWAADYLRTTPGSTESTTE